MFGGLIVRWLGVFILRKIEERIRHSHTWDEVPQSQYIQNKDFLLRPLRTTSFSNLCESPNLRQLMFTSPTSTFYGFSPCTLHSMKETIAHRRIRMRNQRALKSPPSSPSKNHHSVQSLEDFPLHHHIPRPSRVLHCQPMDLPKFLFYTIPKIQVKPHRYFCPDRGAAWRVMKENLCGTPEGLLSVLYGSPEIYELVRWYNPWHFFTAPAGGLMCSKPIHGWSGCFVPDKESLISDAGKLSVLDTLLAKLKAEGHRVLIYSQMTRMIDLLEEYMWHRKHTYMRLDGSSKISDRRDMVADFQTRSDIFVFLLSTRAGGLGINLTAADTVIFYDSDWNPTVDQQAMDRAHRLGQTKQVTVYRLVCKGTIEERILERAREKSEIQRMVISGGNYKTDMLKPKEVVSLLLDDEEIEKKLKLGKQDGEGGKDKDRKRKREYKKRENKKSKGDDVNVTYQADSESVYSLDSTSVPASPLSVMSVGSEATNQQAVDDSSNDALVIVDDSHYPPVTPTSKRGKRGRPKGSTGVPRRSRGRGGVRKSLSAAELAGAQAGMTAAYAAYGYNIAGASPASKLPAPTDSSKSESPSHQKS